MCGIPTSMGDAVLGMAVSERTRQRSNPWNTSKKEGKAQHLGTQRKMFKLLEGSRSPAAACARQAWQCRKHGKAVRATGHVWKTE